MKNGLEAHASNPFIKVQLGRDLAIGRLAAYDLTLRRCA